MKQGIGSSFGHFSNIFLSVLIAESLTDADECQWYCLTYVIDSTIGTMINLLLLHLFGRILQYFPSCTTMHFGEYGSPPQLSIWFPQLLIWLSFVLIGKLTILFFLFQFIDVLNRIISVIFKIFHDNPQLELVIVMIIIPTILNILQFWVTDTFLKSNNNRSSISNNNNNNNTAMLISDYDLGEDLISDHDHEEELSSYELQQQQQYSTEQSRTRNRIIRGTKYTVVKHTPQEVEMIESSDVIYEKNVDIITNNNTNSNLIDSNIADRDRNRDINAAATNLFIKSHNPIQNISFKSNKNI